MTTVEQLKAQRDALNKQIEQMEREGRQEAVARVRELMSQFGLTARDISASPKKSPGRGSLAGTKVAAKYRDPETGKTWTGRGVAPKWIAGKDRDTFLIK